MKHRLLSKLKITISIVLVAGTLGLAYLVTPLFGNKVLIVRSGSMAPTLPVGSLVVTHPRPNIVSPLPAVPLYSPGDIIAFKDNHNPKTVTSHRVVSYKIDNGLVMYQTKGDANNDIDRGQVAEKNILGNVRFTIPFAGILFAFTKTKVGFLILVLFPSLMVIIWESVNIIKELRKKKLLRYSYLKNYAEKVSLTAMVPLLAVGLVFTQTHAYFSNSGTSTNNVFAAKASFGTPIAQTLVINEVLPSSSCVDANKTVNWIEVWNGSNATVNLKNFKISDGTLITDLVTANSNLAPGAFALIAKDGSIFNNGNTKGNKCFADNGAATLNLGNSSPVTFTTGTLKLLQSDGITVIDKVQFNGTFNGVNLTVPTDQSIERVPLGKDSVTGDNFDGRDFIIRETPTPGYGTNVVLNEFVYRPGVTFSTEWIELYNPSNIPVDLTGWTLVDAANNTKSLTSLGTINAGTFKTFDISPEILNNSSADNVTIKDSTGIIIDNHNYTGTNVQDQSFGRLPDAGLWKATPCTTPTKGTSNTGSC